MSAVGRVLFREIRINFCDFRSIGNKSRCLSTATPSTKDDQDNEQSTNETFKNNIKSRDKGPMIATYYRHIYPEFLPDPNPAHRNSIREKLERMDMMARRTVIDIPEFYVGSILAVTHSEPHAPGKSNRFVGICIQRKGCGLRATFLLRNVVDHQGIEVLYDLYDPAIQKIECLRLQKRLDEQLLYLRDAPPEYSTFPFDMEMEFLPEGTPVPINDLKITLKPPPWLEKYERQDLKGVIGYTTQVTEKKQKRAKASAKPWEKYDLMKIYRETIPEEEQELIYSEVYTKLHTLELSRQKYKRKRNIVRPIKKM